MNRDQYVGIIWVVVAIADGAGSGIIQERWFTVGGAMFFVLMAVTVPIWRRWLPEGDDSGR